MPARKARNKKVAKLREAPRDNISYGDLSVLFSYRTVPELFLPIADSSYLKKVSLSRAEWGALELALGEELLPALRHLVTATCSDLVFGSVFYEQLMAPKRYAGKLMEEVCQAAAALEVLLDTLTNTDGKGIVLTPRDHFVKLARSRWARQIIALEEMDGELIDIEFELLGWKPSSPGVEGDYQLIPLYENLVRIAEAAGAHMGINPRSAREKGAGKFTPTPLVRFTEEVFRILGEGAEKFVAAYQLPDQASKTATERLQNLVLKSGKNLIDPLGRARASVRRPGGRN